MYTETHVVQSVAQIHRIDIVAFQIGEHDDLERRRCEDTQN